MIANFKHKGIWWLPDNKDVKIEGTLHFSPQEDPRLELTGSFADVTDIMKISRWDIVLGFTVTGKKVTLLNCLSTGTQLHMPGMPTSEIIPRVVFIGFHFPRIDQIMFDNVSVRYSLLDEWLGISGFSIERSLEEKKTVVTYQLPKPIKATINENLSISILFNATGPFWATGATTEAKISQISKFQINPSEPKDFDFYQRINHDLRNLLSLATLRRVHPIYIKGTTGDDIIDIFYRNIFYYPDESKIKTPFDIVFSFAEIKDRLGDFLRQWFETCRLLEPVHNLYFGTIHSPKMYIEHRFLSLCQAVEAYHRRVSSGVYRLKDEFMKMIYPALIEAIPEGTESNYRESIKERLKYLNEYSLRRRLKEIVENHEAVISTLIPKTNKFIGDIVDTRNIFTHYDDSLKEKSLDGELLHISTERLQFMLEVCFLSELAFSHEDMNRLINKTQRYNYLKSKKDA